MPEDVRTDVLLRVWESDAGAQRVLGQEIAYTRAREAPPNTIGEEGGIELLGPAQPLFLHIRPKQRDSTEHQWDNPAFPALAGPLPLNGTCAGLSRRTARGESSISSCTRAPVSYRRLRRTASRRPVRVVRS